jgi:hypothetical protein
MATVAARPRRITAKVLITLLALAAILIAARVAAPRIVKHYVNLALADMGD